MPFDTTYHIYPHPNSNLTTITFYGGRDTDIYLQQGELPPGVDSSVFIPEVYNSNTVQTIPVDGREKYNPYDPGSNFVLIFFAIFIFIVIKVIRDAKDHYHYDSHNFSETVVQKRTYLTYEGDELNVTDGVIVPILTKHFPYFNALGQANKEKFLQRLKKFVRTKTFKIHDVRGFKEMPVLISATAIQLSFGLEKFLLPNFEYIHIYPEEFLGTHPSIRFLEGNVSGQSIRISWKHFLEGFQYPADGQNVGLHEMAHAYYYQNFETGEYIDAAFVNNFPQFNNDADKAFEAEKMPGAADLYSDYALKNFQEFWAESIEIFFEKPGQLKNSYPELYGALCELLNQDPMGLKG